MGFVEAFKGKELLVKVAAQNRADGIQKARLLLCTNLECRDGDTIVISSGHGCVCYERKGSDLVLC